MNTVPGFRHNLQEKESERVSESFTLCSSLGRARLRLPMLETCGLEPIV